MSWQASQYLNQDPFIHTSESICELSESQNRSSLAHFNVRRVSFLWQDAFSELTSTIRELIFLVPFWHQQSDMSFFDDRIFLPNISWMYVIYYFLACHICPLFENQIVPFQFLAFILYSNVKETMKMLICWKVKRVG